MIDKFRLNDKKHYITLWGMHPISKRTKDFLSMSLLYIGTLSSRKVHETVFGLALYIQNGGCLDGLKYDIIGSGKEEDVAMLKMAIQENHLEDVVFYHGYLSDSDIVAYFENCNIGVAYVPITEYFNDVIPTKTVEYLLSGMAVLATATNENSKLINVQNGILCGDNPEEFAAGLNIIFSRLQNYSSEIIADIVKTYSIEHQVKYSIVPIIKEIVS